MGNRIYIDNHLFNFEECMFGGKDENWGMVKFSGDSILNLTDGNVYRCCGVFAERISLINDLGNKVSVTANMEWTSGRKKEPHFARIQLIEDFTKAKFLCKIINDGKEVYPKPNEAKGGIVFPAMLICSLNKKEKPIAIYPDPTPEALINQKRMTENFTNAIAPIVLDKMKQKHGDHAIERAVSIKKTKLQDLRESLNLSQSELSKRSGISIQIIKKYELPENDLKNAKGEVLLALAKSFNCSIEQLLS